MTGASRALKQLISQPTHVKPSEHCQEQRCRPDSDEWPALGQSTLARDRPPGGSIPLEPVQVGADIRRILVAHVPVFLQSLAHYPLYLPFHLGIHPHSTSRITF